MTIQIELKPETEALMMSQAQSHGMALETYAATLLDQAMAGKLQARSRASQEEFEMFLKRMARDAPDPPHLRNATFSREMLYDNHD